jgi:hypothetical protein
MANSGLFFTNRLEVEEGRHPSLPSLYFLDIWLERHQQVPVPEATISTARIVHLSDKMRKCLELDNTA